MPIKLKRAYGKVAKADGCRILVERLWPRGVSKEDAKIDEWLKEITPSTKLRKWFHHDPERWDEFRKQYEAELESADEVVTSLVERLRKRKTLTFVYAAKDEEHNSAIVLKEYIEGLLADD